MRKFWVTKSTNMMLRGQNIILSNFHLLENLENSPRQLIFCVGNKPTPLFLKLWKCIPGSKLSHTTPWPPLCGMNRIFAAIVQKNIKSKKPWKRWVKRSGWSMTTGGKGFDWVRWAPSAQMTWSRIWKVNENQLEQSNQPEDPNWILLDPTGSSDPQIWANIKWI